MERIREALKRARQERDAQVRSFGSSSGRAASAEGAKPSVAYVRTPTIQVPRDLLLEHRIISGVEGVNGYMDRFKILGTQVLQRLREKGWNTLMITSPTAQEGKTLIAINLAVSLAMEVDHTALLVDADLRKPSVHKYFGLHPSSGLGDYLASGGTIEEMLVHPGIDSLTLLPGGKLLLNSSEMLGSPKMASLVRELKSRYPSRIVIFDLPPLLSAADVLAFSPHADAVLLVVEEGKTRKDDLSRAAEMLSASNLIGAVLNKSTEVRMTAEEPSGKAKKNRLPERGSH